MANPSLFTITIHCLILSLFNLFHIFTLWLIKAHPTTRIPVPWFMKFKPFHGHRYYILSMSDLEVEENFFNRYNALHCMTYLSMPLHKMVIKFILLVDPALIGFQFYILSNFIDDQYYRRRYLQIHINFTRLPQHYFDLGMCIYKIYDFSSPSPTDATCTKIG